MPVNNNREGFKKSILRKLYSRTEMVQKYSMLDSSERKRETQSGAEHLEVEGKPTQFLQILFFCLAV